MADENKNKPMSLVNDTFRTLRNDVVVVGKARVRSWHAWLAIGLAVGVFAGTIFVANRSGEFDPILAQLAPTTSLVAHWKFEGNANDSAGTNNGTLVNGPTFTTGKIGQALSFDGQNDRVSIGSPAPLDNLNAKTISFWMNFTNAPQGEAILIDKQDSGTSGWTLWAQAIISGTDYRF